MGYPELGYISIAELLEYGAELDLQATSHADGNFISHTHPLYQMLRTIFLTAVPSSGGFVRWNL